MELTEWLPPSIIHHRAAITAQRLAASPAAMGARRRRSSATPAVMRGRRRRLWWEEGGTGRDGRQAASAGVVGRQRRLQMPANGCHGRTRKASPPRGSGTEPGPPPAFAAAAARLLRPAAQPRGLAWSRRSGLVAMLRFLRRAECGPATATTGAAGRRMACGAGG